MYLLKLSTCTSISYNFVLSYTLDSLHLSHITAKMITWLIEKLSTLSI